MRGIERDEGGVIRKEGGLRGMRGIERDEGN